jgi:hypothetical protein
MRIATGEESSAAEERSSRRDLAENQIEICPAHVAEIGG